MPAKKDILIRNKFQVRFGAHLRKVRQALKLTQVDLAKRSGIVRSNIARLETGQKNPSLFILSKLSTGMKISVSRLLKGFK